MKILNLVIDGLSSVVVDSQNAQLSAKILEVEGSRGTSLSGGIDRTSVDVVSPLEEVVGHIAGVVDGDTSPRATATRSIS